MPVLYLDHIFTTCDLHLFSSGVLPKFPLRTLFGPEDGIFILFGVQRTGKTLVGMIPTKSHDDGAENTPSLTLSVLTKGYKTTPARYNDNMCFFNIQLPLSPGAEKMLPCSSSQKLESITSKSSCPSVFLLRHWLRPFCSRRNTLTSWSSNARRRLHSVSRASTWKLADCRCRLHIDTSWFRRNNS